MTWIMHILKDVQCKSSYILLNDIKGNCIPNQNWACFVPYLKIIDTFLKYNTSIIEQIHQDHWVTVNKIVLNTDPKSCTYFVYISITTVIFINTRWQVEHHHEQRRGPISSLTYFLWVANFTIKKIPKGKGKINWQLQDRRRYLYQRQSPVTQIIIDSKWVPTTRDKYPDECLRGCHRRLRCI